MASWSNATVTEKGYALQAKLLSTDSLVITKVVSGSGRVTAGQLVNQTAVSEEKQTLSVEALSYDNNGNAIIKTSLNNKNLTTGYICNQIGIYAADPDEGEILYAIAQEASAGEDIPSITEQPNGYYCSWVFSLTFSNSSNISVTIDTANALTKAAADALYSPLGKIIPVSEGGTGANNDVSARYKLGVGHFRDCDDGEQLIGDEYIAGEQGAAAVNFGKAVGRWSLAVNYGLTYGEGAFAANYATANGMYAHAVNRSNANGTHSFAANYADADGIGAFACGYNSKALDYQFVAGQNNREVSGPTTVGEQTADSSIFMIGYGTYVTPANAFRVSTAGKCYGSAAFVGSGADFPEFEEWADGNPENEDRRGRFVALEGDKIVLASSEKDHIIGVISAMGAFIANGASENWHGMYLKDVFGENLTQQVEVPEEIIEKKVIETDEEGNKVEKTVTEVIPAHTVTQFVVNPDYNPDEEYIGREFRKEWAPVGKLGQVIVVDDGTCTVGGYCKPSANGIGTAGEYGYYVRKRIDSTHIKVEISPGAFNK